MMLMRYAFITIAQAFCSHALALQPESQDGVAGEQRIPFTNRLLAFRALKQGLKFRFDDWRMWANYMIVAMDVGELSEACRALGRIVEERSAKDGVASVDEDVLEQLVNASTHGSREGEASDAGSRHWNEGLLRQVSDLFDRVILPRVSSPRIFRAQARLLTAQGRLEDALKAYLSAYQNGIAGTIEKGETDAEKWRQGVKEVEEMEGMQTLVLKKALRERKRERRGIYNDFNIYP